MEALLEGMGLTSYEARALAHLMRHGERTGPDISRAVEIPFGRVYDTLNGLIERGLVTAHAGRPKRYEAVAAQTVPGRLLAIQRRHLQAEDKRAEEQARELEKALDAMRPRSEPAGHAYSVRLGEDAAREHLIETTLEARADVQAYLAFDVIQDEDLELFDAFRQAVARGVRTRVLLRAADVDYLLTTPYVDHVLDAMLPHLGQNLEVRLTEEDRQPFAAIDGRRIMIGVKDPTTPAVYFGVVHVDDAAFAGRLGAAFATMWDGAEEPRDLVQWALGKRSGRGLAKLGARLRGKGRDDPA